MGGNVSHEGKEGHHDDHHDDGSKEEGQAKEEYKVVESMPPTSFPDWYVKDPSITQEDIDHASNSFQIIMSGFWTAPFVEMKKNKDFRHSSTTTWFYETFYEGLFQRRPDARPLFKHISMFTQGRLLVGALSVALDVLAAPDRVSERLIKLTKRHNELGIRAEYYFSFGEALFEALKTTLGPLFSKDTEVAWTKLYSYMLGIIIPVVVHYDRKHSSRNLNHK